MMRCPSCGIENLEDSKFCRRCATALPGGAAPFTRTMVQGPAELAPGTVIAGHYKIDKILGRGGMGVVYLADDTRLKRPVALKFLPPGLALDEAIRKRFMIEAQAAAALSHPNICTIYEVDDQAEKAFISMEYVEGESLREKVARGPLPFDQVLDIALQVCAGLDEAHKKGIVHRDIKSANIMLTVNGQAKIMDFGLAKVAGEAMITKEGSTMGTVAYMSPEQAKGEAVDARTDIWSLGVVLYELAGGKLPFRGDLESAVIHNIIHEEPEPLKAIVPKVHADFERIVKRALKKTLDDRYRSATEMLADLRNLHATLDQEKAGVFNPRSFFRLIRKPVVAVPATLLIAAVAFGLIWLIQRQARIQWARDVAVPEIRKLLDDQQLAAAFRLAEQAEKVIPRDPLLLELLPQVERDFSFHTVPPGADVYLYDELDRAWEHIGRSPIDKVRTSPGYRRWKIEKDAYEFVEGASVSVAGSITGIKRTLDEKGSLPSGMVRVPGGQHVLGLAGLDHLSGQDLDDYLIDKYEVTNEEFKQFIDRGGYEKREYWAHPFEKDGITISWEQALAGFKDRTGRPGPATWEMSDYPEGRGDHPVNGISWYEAAAYAQFVGKSLPTIYHWDRAADTPQSSSIIPLSNFSNRDSAPVGGSQGVSAYGVHDMAGNVREWCWNQRGEWRFLVGGAWDDRVSSFNYAYAQPPMDRSPGNGFRCMRSLGTDDREALKAKIDDPYVDFMSKEPVSDEVYNIYLNMYSYDKKDLNSRTESVDESEKDWIREKVSFDAAYGGERVSAYLFLPRSGKPPYQTVVYFPGSSAINRPSSEKNEFFGIGNFDFIMKSGRALLFPIYKSTYERADDLVSSVPDESNFYRDHVILWAKDLSRSLDYLESRNDIDPARLAYYGFSWGGRLGGLMIAVGGRFKTAILYVAGFRFQKQKPEVDPFHFVSRVRIPVLMLNGRYDNYFPYQTSQLPMFKLLGTPEEHKRQILYETGHSIPRNQLIKESLEWLDKYLGPVIQAGRIDPDDP